jgi:hypothetical protein
MKREEAQGNETMRKGRLRGGGETRRAFVEGISERKGLK